MAAFAFRALPVFSARDATLDFEQLTFALNKGDLEINAQGELKVLTAAALTGAWTNPEGFSAKLEKTTTLQVRTEGGKTVARLKGQATAKEAIPAATLLFTLPAGFRPPETVKVWAADASTNEVLYASIEATGKVLLAEELKVAHLLNVDGITFNLT